VEFIFGRGARESGIEAVLVFEKILN